MKIIQLAEVNGPQSSNKDFLGHNSWLDSSNLRYTHEFNALKAY